VLYLIALPGVALLQFQGRPFQLAELWVGPTVLGLTLLAIIVLWRRAAPACRRPPARRSR
jgi:hypothetical protein